MFSEGIPHLEGKTVPTISRSGTTTHSLSKVYEDLPPYHKNKYICNKKKMFQGTLG